jgi:hypothetical protein
LSGDRWSLRSNLPNGSVDLAGLYSALAGSLRAQLGRTAKLSLRVFVLMASHYCVPLNQAPLPPAVRKRLSRDSLEKSAMRSGMPLPLKLGTTSDQHLRRAGPAPSGDVLEAAWRQALKIFATNDQLQIQMRWKCAE